MAIRIIIYNIFRDIFGRIIGNSFNLHFRKVLFFPRNASTFQLILLLVDKLHLQVAIIFCGMTSFYHRIVVFTLQYCKCNTSYNALNILSPMIAMWSVLTIFRTFMINLLEVMVVFTLWHNVCLLYQLIATSNPTCNKY